MTKEQEILTSEIKKLPVSENFYLRSKLLGHENLAAIDSTPVSVLVEKDEFNYKWMGELRRFLMTNNMLHTLQQLPGNRS